MADIVYTDSLEEDIGAASFQCVRYATQPSFEQLPSDGWTSDDFPLMSEGGVTDYLKVRGGYTKNFRTGVCLCQCSYLFDLKMVRSGSFSIKCLSTM